MQSWHLARSALLFVLLAAIAQTASSIEFAPQPQSERAPDERIERRISMPKSHAATARWPGKTTTCPGCGAIAGTVRVDGSNAAIPNVVVRVLDENISIVAVAVSNASGSFDTGLVLPPADYRVQFFHAEYVGELFDDVPCPNDSCQVSDGTTVAVQSGASSPVHALLTPGAGVSGQVTSNGTPVPNVAVTAITPQGFGVQTSTAPDGTYAIPRILPAGSYRVFTVNDVGLIDEVYPDTPCIGSNACQILGGQPVLLDAGEIEVANFALEQGARIAGNVTGPDAQPVVGATVTFWRPDPETYVSAQTDGSGNYTSPTGLDADDWFAYVPADSDRLGQLWQGLDCASCTPGAGTPIPLSGSGTQAGIDFVLKAGGRISGTVTNQRTGAPIDGVIVVIDPVAEQPLNFAVGQSDGTYLSTPLLAGGYRLSFEANGFQTRHYGATGCEPDCTIDDGAVLTVLDGQTLEDIDITLSDGARISGRVTDGNGAGVPDAVVFAQYADGSQRQQAVTDLTGNYEIGALVAGDYVVVAESTDYFVRTAWPNVRCAYDCPFEDLQTVTVADGGEATGIDIAMSRGGRIQGHITDAGNGSNLSGIVLTPRPMQDDTIVATTATTNLAGVYTTEALPAGAYYLVTEDTGGYLNEAFDNVPCNDGCDNALLTPLVVEVGQTETADFALERGGRIAVRVVQAGNGQPLGTPRPNVRVLRAQDGSIADLRSADFNGDFISRGLEPGTYYVRSANRTSFIDELYEEAPCYWCPFSTATPVVITAGNDTGPLVLDLVPGARLGGTVTLAGDSPRLSEVGVRIYDDQARLIVTMGVGANTQWRMPNGLPPGTYFLRTINAAGYYQDELLGGIACGTGCDPLQATPVVVSGTTEITGLDFSLDIRAQVFANGFED